MRSAEHYIETHIDRFYRILHFEQLLELNEAVPLDALPVEHQDMLFNNETYRQLLIIERNVLNARLERYGVRSQVEMGLILSSPNVFGRYILQVINNRHSNSVASGVIDRNYLTLLQLLPQ